MFTKEQIIKATTYAEGFRWEDDTRTIGLAYGNFNFFTLREFETENKNTTWSIRSSVYYPLFLQNTIEGIEDEHLIIIKPEQNFAGWRYHIVEQDNRYNQTYSGFSYATRLEAKEQGILCVFAKLSRRK